MKMVVLGIDGLSYRPFSRPNHNFRNLKRIQSRSKWGILESVDSTPQIPHTGPAWSSLYTGVNPEMHGVTEGGWLLDHKGYSDLQVNTIFQLISKKYTLGIFTMPITYPVDVSINGWMVSGFPSPSINPDCIYPPQLLDWLKTEEVDYDLFSGKTINHHELNDVESLIHEKTRCIKKLYQRHPVDILFLGYTFVDKLSHEIPMTTKRFLGCFIYYLQHQPSKWILKIFEELKHATLDFLYPISQEMLSVYNLVDNLVGDVYDYFQPDYFIICSDHGFCNISFNKPFHDPFGFVLLKNKENYSQKRIKMKITDIPYYILTSLEIDEKLGIPHLDTKYGGLTEHEYTQISSQLQALGYI